MTSKIVVNNIEADSGINTVSFNDQIKVGSETTIHSTGIDLGSGNINSHNLNSTGIVTAIGLDVSGNVSIAGTLTYEDVTNIDAVGIITAQSGIHVTSGSVGIGTNNPSELLHLQSGHTKQILKSTNLNTASSLIFDTQNINTADFLLGQLAGRWNGNDVAYINFEAGSDTTNDDDGVITFLTSASGSSPTERLRISSDGSIATGGLLPTDGSFCVNSTIRSQNSSSNISYIGFTQYTSNTTVGGMFSYMGGDGRSTGYLTFNTNDTERLRITSNGNVGIGSTIPTDILDIQTGSSDEVTKFKVKTAGQLELTRNHTSAPYIKTLMGSGNPNIILGDSAGDKVKINGDGASYFNGGNLGIGTDNPQTKLELFTNDDTDIQGNGGTNNQNSILRLFNKNGTDNTAVNNYVGIRFDVSNGATSSAWLNYVRTGNNQGAFLFKARNAASSYPELMRITSDGNVSINTTYPRARLDLRQASGHPAFNIGFPDDSFYRNLGTVGPDSSDGSTGQYLHVRLRTVWNDSSMTMFRVTGYYPYSVYGESYVGMYRYGNNSYRNSPYGQVISNQGNKAIINSVYNTTANPGYLVIVCDWNTTYNGLMIEHYGAGGAYGSYMQHDLEIIDTKRSTNTSAQW